MNKLTRLIDLIKKTGDKIVITSEFDDEDILMMPLKEYEKIFQPISDVKNLSESELLDRINRDIAIWKEGREIEEEAWNNQPLPDLDHFDNEDASSPWSMPEKKWLADDLEENDNDVYPTDEKIADWINPWQEKTTPDNIDAEKTSNESTDFFSNNLEKKEEFPEKNINYEEIPPPPDIIMPRETMSEPEKIIDISLPEIVPTKEEESETEDLEEETSFDEEPVY